GALHRQVVGRDRSTVAQQTEWKLITGHTALGYVIASVYPEHAGKLRVAPDVFAFRVGSYRDADRSRIDQFAELLVDDFQGASLLAQRLLCLLAVGNVTDSRDPSGDVAGGIFLRHISDSHEAAADFFVGNLAFIFDRFSVEDLCNMRTDGFAGVFTQDLNDRFTHNLFRCKAEALRIGSIDESIALVAAPLREHHRRSVGDQANLSFLGAQGFLGVLALGDIHAHAHQFHRLSSGIE